MRTFWRWTGTIFFALVFVFLVITGIGTSLPVEHHASCSATFQKPNRFLFAAVEDDGTSTLWRPEITRAESISGSGATAVWRETDIRGQVLTYRTVADIKESKLVRAVDFVPGMPFGGTWTYIFSPDGMVAGHRPSGKTTVTIIEDGQIYNPVFRFLARYFFGYTQSMRTYLEDLAKLSAESPPVTCVVNA